MACAEKKRLQTLLMNAMQTYMKDAMPKASDENSSWRRYFENLGTNETELRCWVSTSTN